VDEPSPWLAEGTTLKFSITIRHICPAEMSKSDAAANAAEINKLAQDMAASSDSEAEGSAGSSDASLDASGDEFGHGELS